MDESQEDSDEDNSSPEVSSKKFISPLEVPENYLTAFDKAKLRHQAGFRSKDRKPRYSIEGYDRYISMAIRNRLSSKILHKSTISSIN